jgi:hypothetical protein
MSRPEGERHPNQTSPADLGAKEITARHRSRKRLPIFNGGASKHMRNVPPGARGRG